MANKVKVPGGAFYAGDGLTVDQTTRTVSAGGGSSVSTPDWNQNDATASDYIKNRPGGYTKTTPGHETTWDGVVGDKVVVVGGGMQFVKVSDRVFTVEELIGATIITGNQSFTINNGDIESQNGVINTGYGVLVCTAPTTIVGITIPEAGTYFEKAGEEFVSSLSKPGSTTTIKIPAELTTVVGGYDAAERTAVIFDGTVKASDFTEVESYYAAPIALTENLIEGATVSGTINGAQVSGTVEEGHVNLYVDNSPVAIISDDAGNYKIQLGMQPESDFTIHLTQAMPAHKVIVPEEYLELTKTNKAISAAMSAADTAKTTADTAQTTADTAQTTADTAKTTADTAKTTAETAQSTAKNAVHREIIDDSNTKYAYYDLGPGATDDSIHSVLANIGWSGGSGLRIKVEGETNPSVTFTSPVYGNYQADFAFARASDAYPHPKITEIGGIVMYSRTAGSTKKFSITVDDSGVISATEITK